MDISEFLEHRDVLDRDIIWIESLYCIGLTVFEMYWIEFLYSMCAIKDETWFVC